MQRSTANALQMSDELLAARVRAEMSREVPGSGAISVVVREGVVTLSGPVLLEDEKSLIKCVQGIDGVMGVENRLEQHSRDDKIPGLQHPPHHGRVRFGVTILPALKVTSIIAACLGGISGALWARRKFLQ